MQTRLLVLCALVLTVSAAGQVRRCQADEKTVAIPITNKWSGSIAIKLKEAAPKMNYIANKTEWEKLWKLYREKEEVPAVDFEKDLVLVAVNRDPNYISIEPKVDEQGDLQLSMASTLAAYHEPTTCRYQFVLIQRSHFKTYRGKPIPQQ